MHTLNQCKTIQYLWDSNQYFNNIIFKKSYFNRSDIENHFKVSNLDNGLAKKGRKLINKLLFMFLNTWNRPSKIAYIVVSSFLSTFLSITVEWKAFWPPNKMLCNGFSTRSHNHVHESLRKNFSNFSIQIEFQQWKIHSSRRMLLRTQWHWKYSIKHLTIDIIILLMRNNGKSFLLVCSCFINKWSSVCQ